MEGFHERVIPISILVLSRHRGQHYYKGEEIVIPPILTWNAFNKNHVNDVNMLIWIPSVKLKAKARLVNG